jgi:hypothetical protein
LKEPVTTPSYTKGKTPKRNKRKRRNDERRVWGIRQEVGNQKGAEV